MKTKETKLPTLFGNEEAHLRDHKGRFCTKEMFYADKALEENKRLRTEKEKYYRSWIAVGERNSYLERELIMLKAKFNGLAKELARIQ